MSRPWLAVLIIVFLTAIVFEPVIFHFSAMAGNYGDVYQHYYPMKHLVAEQVISGKIPFWNPYIFTGEPLLANPQSSVFYPLSVFFYVLPLSQAFNIFEMLHIVAGGVFFFLLLKHYKRSHTAALSGAVTYCFSSFLLYKIPAGHPAALSGYIWLPILILFSENLSNNQEPVAMIFLALTLVFQFLSGHAFPLFIGIVFLVVYVLFKRFAGYKYFATAAVLALLLSSIQLLPSYELSKAAENGNLAGLVGNYSISLKNLINFVLPDYYGNIIDKTFVYPLNPSYFFERHCMYIGLIPLLLAIAGFFLSLKRGKYFYPALFVIGIALAIGFQNPVYKILYDHLPGLDLLRVPARFIYLSITSLIILFAFAWDRYIGKFGALVKAILILLIFTDLFVWGNRFIYPGNPAVYRSNNSISEILDPVYRIITEPDMIMPNRSMLYHHFNLNGYEAIFLKSFTRYLGMQETGALNSTGLNKSEP